MSNFKIVGGQVVLLNPDGSLPDQRRPCIEPILKKGSPIMLVGEAPGAEEQRKGYPFVGSSGQLLYDMLADARIDLENISLTNVILTRPPNNDFQAFCIEKDERPTDYTLPRIDYARGRGNLYLHPHFLPDLKRLAEEILYVQPNIVIGLGNKALWALNGITGIRSHRGTVREGQVLTTDVKVKFLPTMHPAAIMRMWRDRPIVVADLIKAKRESRSPNLNYTSTNVWIRPTLEDLYEFERNFLPPGAIVACDIETQPEREQITCVGFASDPHNALVIPFVDKGRFGYSYWPTMEEEVEAWKFITRILTTRRLVFQNNLYDVQWFIRQMGIIPKYIPEDTMLMHHAQQPEVSKGLAFLGTLYCDRPPWKMYRVATDKRED